MIVTHKIKIDLVNPEFTPQINAVQDDRYVRNIEFFLTADYLPWDIPEDSTVIIRYFKCDGKGGEYDTLPDKTRAYTISKNLLTIALAPQVLTTAGNTMLSVTISQGQSIISLFTISINVRGRLNADLAESENYYNVAFIEEIIQKAVTAADSANSARADLLKARDDREFDGATFIPYVSDDGFISWSNNKGLNNPKSISILGPKGNPATVQSTSTDYRASDSGTAIPSGAWVQTVPTVPQGGYLWTRTTTQFNSGNPVVSYSVSRMGMDGTGSVSTVNQVSPDSNGNVQLLPSDVGAVSKGYADQRYSKAIVKATAGASISVPDSGEAPLNGLKLYGKTTQSGTPSPENPVPLVSVGDGGAIGVQITGKNLLPKFSNYSGDGFSFSVNDDGSVTANNADKSKQRYIAVELELYPGTYIVSGSLPGSVLGDGDILVQELPDAKAIARSYGEFNQEFNIDAKKTLRILLRVKTQSGNRTFYPMIRLATCADPTYEPYKASTALAVNTPNGLPGIPVNSGGNYTDGNGQQWICDEIDFARGKYVQRIRDIKTHTISSSCLSAITVLTNTVRCWAYIDTAFGLNAMVAKETVLCDKLPYKDTYDSDQIGIMGGIGSGYPNSFVLWLPKEAGSTADEIKAYLETINLRFLIADQVATETTLPSETLAQYAAMRTQRPNTTIQNDAGAWMELEYVTDSMESGIIFNECAKANDYAAGLRVRNLLDNSDFTNPVNQRGRVGYISSDYGLDRWYFLRAACTLANGYSEFTGELIWQFLQHNLTGKPVTAAIQLADGTVYAASGVVPAAGDKTQGVIHLEFENGGSLDLNLSVSNLLQYILVPGSQPLRVVNAALYEGTYTAETLPPYVSKGYQAELDICQKYWFKICENGTVYITASYSVGNVPRVEIKVPAEMRVTNPSLVLDGNAEVFTGTGWVGIALTYQTRIGASYVYIFDPAGLEPGKTYIVRGLKALDAEFSA